MNPRRTDDLRKRKDLPLVLQRMLELWNGGADDPAAVYASGCTLDGGPTTFEPDEVAVEIASLRAAFPDLRFVVDETFSAGARHVLKMRAAGSHSGAPFRTEIGIAAPSGRPVEMRGIEVFEIKDELIVDVWVGWNFAQLYAGLGARLDPALTGQADILAPEL
jgi:hypothetical protein